MQKSSPLVDKFRKYSEKRAESDYSDIESVKWQMKFLEAQYWHYMELVRDPIRWTSDEESDDSGSVIDQYLSWVESGECQSLTAIYQVNLRKLQAKKDALERKSE